MRQVLLDAAIVFKWFADDEEPYVAAARALEPKDRNCEIQVCSLMPAVPGVDKRQGDSGRPTGGDIDETEEWLLRERRTLFVGMTGAMRALLVVAPADK